MSSKYPIVIIFDGVENAGKTTLMNEIYKKYKSNSFMNNQMIFDIKYPSPYLCKTYFPSFHDDSSEAEKKLNTIKFIDELTDKIKKDLGYCISMGYDMIFVDRMYLSTFVYQGYKFDSDDILQYSIKKYMNIFCDIFPNLWQNVYNITFTDFMKQDEDQRKVDEYSKLYDDKKELYRNNTLKLLNSIEGVTEFKYILFHNHLVLDYDKLKCKFEKHEGFDDTKTYEYVSNSELYNFNKAIIEDYLDFKMIKK